MLVQVAGSKVLVGLADEGVVNLQPSGHHFMVADELDRIEAVCQKQDHHQPDQEKGGVLKWVLNGNQISSKTLTSGKDAIQLDKAILTLENHSTVIYTHPTDADGAPIETDIELAQVAADFVSRLLELQCDVSTSAAERNIPRKLTAADIGIVSTHNQMNSAIQACLPAELIGTDAIQVTTPERWQGLQRAVMIAVHPLSGVQTPSAFDLETGRLCVMASRHKAACIFITRDHVGDTLNSHLPAADQALGRGDTIGRGHAQHTAFWQYHEKRNLIV